MLENNIIFRSASKNRYFYSNSKKQLLLCHPLLEYLIKLKGGKVPLKKWIDSVADNPINIDNNMVFFRNEVLYYYQKYKMLEENNYFEETDALERINGRLSSDDIKSSLANSRQILFEVTDNCNLNCKYCGYGEFYTDYDKREKKNLKFNVAKKALDFMIEYWNSNLNKSHNREVTVSFYGGEPLMNFKLIERIVNYALKQRLRYNTFSFSMTTNGVLLKKHAEFLSNNCFKLLISIDGNQIHNSYRTFHNGNPSYFLVFENIKYLQSNYPDYFKKLVNFNTVIHNRNSIYDVFNHLSHNFGKKPLFNEISSVGINKEKIDEFNTIYKNMKDKVKADENYIMKQNDLSFEIPESLILINIIHNCSGFVFDKYSDFYTPIKKNYIPTGTCIPFSRRIYFTVNGKILPCEKIGQHFSLGSIDNNGIVLDFQKVADKYNEYFDKMRATNCNNCCSAANSLCKECLFRINIEDEIPECKSFSDNNLTQKIFTESLSFLENNPVYYSKIMKEIFVV